MGLLNFFDKPVPELLHLPSGSFTVDRGGEVLTNTLSSNFPPTLVEEIARQVLGVFAQAAAAQVPLTELIIRYASLKITARELRGGALIFLSPTRRLRENAPATVESPSPC